MRTLSAILIISIGSVSGFGQTAHKFVPLVNGPDTAAHLPRVKGAAAESAGTFAPTGSMTTARLGHTATLLENGKVLIVGGDAVGTTAELYDPATRTFAATGNMTAALGGPIATLLADGRVLIVGGGLGPSASAELYNPSTGTFASAGSLPTIVGIPATATLLNGGKVLITGPSPATNFVAEIYDPLAGTFTATGSMAWGHSGPTATLLASGKVLIAEGACGGGSGSEVYDPASGTFSPTAGNMPCIGYSTATLLPNGKVLIAGGQDVGAEVYDPSTGTFTASADIIYAADGYAATLLPDGTVLISGGEFFNESYCSEESVTNAELYDPATGAFGSAGGMTTPRSGHQSTLLADGTVLISGGIWRTPGGFSDTPLASAEIYNPQTPQYFFSGEGALITSPGSYYLQFPDGNLFGYYGYLSSSILYHVDLGYEAFIPSAADSIYFYDFASTHWWYSSASLFPYLYDFTLGAWIYYIPDTTKPGHYTTNPRTFKNLTTGAIFPM